MENYLVYLRQINLESMLLRIFLAVAVGGLIGFEREKKRRPAGFRTYMLVALGAALTMILSQYLDYMLSNDWNKYLLANDVGNRTDVVRLGAIVVSGIGFLGTGTIVVTGKQQVKGLTTAAGLWASACMGLAVGAGFYECVLVSFLLVFLCMQALPAIETAIMANARNLNVYIEMDSIENLGAIVNHIKASGITLFDVDVEKEKSEHFSQINASFSLHLPKKTQHTEVLADLSMLDGIILIEEI